MSKSEFAAANLTMGQINAVVKKLGGYDMALRFLRDELSVSESTRSWREEDGVIYFSVTSDGTTGEECITRLESKGLHVGDCAKKVLRSADFKPTSDVTTEVAVLDGMLFKDSERITKMIRAEADKRKLSMPNAELACLIREKFSDDEIGDMCLLHIVTMHEPINNIDGGSYLLGAARDTADQELRAYRGTPSCGWRIGTGFAFVKSQVAAAQS